jgi:lysophospholipase L1-like esterase
MKPKNRSLLVNVALLLASILLVFSVAEAVHRVKHKKKVSRLLRGRTEKDLIMRASYDERLYELKPDTGLTNRFGFRDIARSREKEENIFRIALIGDSVSMQAVLPLEKLYFRRLQTLLDEYDWEKKIEILNFGVAGYSTAQEVALLEKTILGFSPDAVLWQFHDNDSMDPRKSNADGGLAAFFSSPRSRFIDDISRKITAYRRKRFIAREGLKKVPSELSDHLYSWDDMTALFERAARICANRKIPVYIFLYPSWPPGDDWVNYTKKGFEVHERLVERFKTLGFHSFDLLPRLEEVDPGLMRYAEDDPWHPNEEGHRWIAVQLAGWLEESLPVRKR